MARTTASFVPGGSTSLVIDLGGLQQGTVGFTGTYAAVTVSFFYSSDGGVTFYPVEVQDQSTGGWIDSVSLPGGTPATAISWLFSLLTATHLQLQLAAAPATGQVNVEVNPVFSKGFVGLGGLGGRKSNASFTVTRPANTTAYAVNQIVGGATAGASLFTFSNLLRARTVPGNGGYVVKLRLRTNQSANVATFRLWLFYVANPAALAADQAAFAHLDADKALTAGYIDVPALTTEGTGSDSAGAVVTPGSSSPGNIPLEVLQPNADRNLYGMLVAKTAFIPLSGQAFWCSLGVEND